MGAFEKIYVLNGARVRAMAAIVYVCVQVVRELV